jgi:hypothetical protein
MASTLGALGCLPEHIVFASGASAACTFALTLVMTTMLALAPAYIVFRRARRAEPFYRELPRALTSNVERGGYPRALMLGYAIVTAAIFVETRLSPTPLPRGPTATVLILGYLLAAFCCGFTIALD